VLSSRRASNAPFSDLNVADDALVAAACALSGIMPNRSWASIRSPKSFACLAEHRAPLPVHGGPHDPCRDHPLPLAASQATPGGNGPTLSHNRGCVRHWQP